MPDLTDWTQAPAAWQDYAKQLPLSQMPDSAYDALREKFFQEQVAPSMLKAGADFSPEASRRAFMEKTGRPSKLPHDLDQAGTQLRAFTNQAASAAMAPLAGLGVADAKEMAQKIYEENQRIEQTANQQWTSTTPARMAGEMAGQAPYWMGGLETAGAFGKAAKVAAGTQRLLNIGAGGVIQGGYDAAKAEDGHRVIEGLGGAAMGAAGVAAFEGLGALLKGRGLNAEQADAVAATTKNQATPKQETLASSALAERPEITQDINSWFADQVKQAKKNGLPKDGLISQPGSRVKIQMTGADGKPYNVGGVAGIDIKDMPVVLDRISKHLEMGGEITSVTGDNSALNDLYRQMDLINKKRGDYNLDVPLKGQSESVVPTSKVVAPLDQPTLEDIEKKAWDLVGNKQIGSTIGLQSYLKKQGMELPYKQIKQLYEKMFPVIEDEQPGGTPLKSSPVAGETPVEPAGTPPPAGAPGEIPPAVAGVDQVRGWLNVPLSEFGEQQARDLGQSFAGQVDNIYHSSMGRAASTAEQIARTNPNASMNSTDSLKPWNLGEHQGQPTSEVIGEMNRLMADAPNEAAPGGEPAADFLKRTLSFAKDKMAAWEQSPSRDVWVSHYRDVKALQAWLKAGMPDDFSIDTEEMLRHDGKPGGVHLLNKDANGEWQISHTDLKPGADLENGIYVVRHGATAWNAEDASAATRQLSQMRSYVSEDQMPQLDRLQVLMNGRVLDKSSGQIYGNVAEAVQGGGSKLGTSEEPPAEGGWSYKETPLVSRVYGPGMTLGQTARASGAPSQLVDELSGATEAKGVTLPESATGQPLVMLTGKSRGLVFHEMTHAHIYGTGLSDQVDHIISSTSPQMMRDLQGAFSPEMKQMYGGNVSPEELYTFSATAVRTDDQNTIAKFAEADGGHESFLDWVSDSTNALREKVAEAPDSLHKRVFERKLGEVNRRASGYLQDIQNGTFDVDGHELSWQNGKYVARELSTGTETTFSTRSQLADWLDQNFDVPLSAPNAVDESPIPANTPRYAADISGYSNKKPPIHTDPPAPSLSDRAPAHGGMMLAWRPFQPFSDWIDIVARKNQWPELADTFGTKLQGAVDQTEGHIYDQQQMLKSNLGTLPPKRQTDLYNYLSASPFDRAQLSKELHFTDKEINALNAFESQMAPLADLHGSSVQRYVQDIAPLLKAKDYDLDALAPRGSITKEDIDFWKPLLDKGRVDPNDTNLLRIADTYVRSGARQTFLQPAIDEAQSLMKMKNAEGEAVVGDLKNSLQRHLDYVRGMPDYSQTIINSALNHSTELINEGIAKANAHLPDRFQIEPIDPIPQDLLSKWTLFSYAGTLGLRPAIPIRAALQLLITGYPVLGGKYLVEGMRRVFPTIAEGAASEAWQVADKNGWLMRPRDYGNLYSGEGAVEQGAVNKMAQNALKPILWGHNASRLVVGWGHVAKFLDALPFKDDPDTFISKSDLSWLPKFKQQSYMKELASGTDPEQLAYRVAKDLVGVSQWNYGRGQSPGLYEYGLGRLFGQYGTWPLNYIEFARKLATHADKGQQVAAITRLALAHGAIMAAGSAAGVDTGGWVFSQPMAYGGGPIFKAVQNVPGSLDFESQRGTEARKELIRPFWPVPVFVPGGLAAQQLLDAINKGDQADTYKVMMGFKPMKAGEEDRGYHGLLP